MTNKGENSHTIVIKLLLLAYDPAKLNIMVKITFENGRIPNTHATATDLKHRAPNQRG